MGSEPPKRRLRAFLSFVPLKSTKSRTRKSTSQPHNDEANKTHSRLRRLSQSLRRWTIRQKKSASSSEEEYYCSKTISSRKSSEGTLSIHCQGVINQGPGGIHHRTGGSEQEHVAAAVEDIVLDDTDAHKEGIISSSVVRAVVNEGEAVASSAEAAPPVSEKPPSPTYNKAVENLDPTFYGPVLSSTPHCVYIRRREEAKQFANSTLSPSSSVELSDRAIYWTDASLRKAKYNENNQDRGGTSVVYRQGGHWQVEYAHVVGLKTPNLLETLAILMALKIALHNYLGARRILILSDSETSLRWLAKVLSLFPAMEEASREFQASKCHARAALSFARDFGVSNLEKYPGSHFQAVLCSPILEVYAKLRQLGAIVKFHWVPGHSDVDGNVLADAWASNACQWFADVSVCVNEKEVLVMPLRPLTPNEHAAASVSQIREGIKDLQYTLKVEDNLRVVPDKACSRSTAQKLLNQSSTPVDKCSSISVIDGTKKSALHGPPAKAIDGKKLRRHLAKCSACKQRGHVRERCPTLEPCGFCRKRGHREETCHRKLPCTVCDRIGHSWKVCPKARPRATPSEPATIMIPEAILAVSLLHPTLVGQYCHGARSRYVLGQVGLNPHLAPSVMLRPTVALGLRSEGMMQ